MAALPLLVLPVSCQAPQAAPAVPAPAAARTSPAVLQERREWVFGGNAPSVTIDNRFPGARVNRCDEVAPHDYRITITPENEPINPSPWYAFRIRAAAPTDVTVRFVIATAAARPHPWTSADGQAWTRVPDADWTGRSGARECTLRLRVGPEVTWVASNRMVGNDRIGAWADALAARTGAAVRTIGASQGERPIRMFEFAAPDAPEDWVVVIGRQHPPEVTGSVGLMAFMDEATGDSPRARDFRRAFRIALVPVVNPDGVDEGQWRSTLGGVDANRDWGPFTQAEVRAVRDAILALRGRPGARIWLALDFHATGKDILYLPKEDDRTFPPRFATRWVAAIQKRFPDYVVESTGSHNVNERTFKRWAFEELGVPGITYELGSATPDARIRRIVAGATDEAMRLLLDAKAVTGPAR